MSVPKTICVDCGDSGRVKFRGRGSLLTLLVLSCLLVVPGAIYLLWMLSGNTHACRRCKSQAVVDVASPRGRQLEAQFRVAHSTKQRLLEEVA